MVSLQDILPPVSNTIWDRELEDRHKLQQQKNALVTTSRAAPPYGHRKSWLPRTEEDFGDGGAFPECHIVQHPLGMGKDISKNSGQPSNTVAVQLDETGKIKYDVLARQGHGKDKIVYSKLTDLLPSAVTSENDPELLRPCSDTVQDVTDKTRQALEKLTQSKISSAMPVRCAEKQAPAQYIRYTPSQQGVAYNSGAQQRVIRMVETPRDPMEPPKFKINKKVPRGPPSPPAPVMHSPTRKVTVKEQQEWRIPPCVSNWKNAKGYTIPLDKRLAADGRGLQSVHINEKFARLAEALYIADRKAREQIEMRAQLEKKMAQKEKVRKEESLKMLAKKAREEHAGLRPTTGGVGAGAGGGGPPGDEAEKEREKLRQDRARERKRDQALQNSKAASDGKGGGGGRGLAAANRERDVTEQIALGLPQRTAGGGEAQFDQRLFNQSRGMDSGFGDDEAYNVYDRPWREASSLGTSLYRPTRGGAADSEAYGLEVEQMLASNRFVPDQGFAGADASGSAGGGGGGGGRRSGPVEFQQSSAGGGGGGGGEEKDEEDLFGVIGLLSEAKNAGKRPSASTSSSSHDHRGDNKRRRSDSAYKH